MSFRRNNIKYLVFTVAIGLLISCSSQVEDYVFRNDDRPAYSKTMKVEELSSYDTSEVTIVDVRLTEDLAKSPNLIDGATYRNPEKISEWASSIPKN